MIDVEDFLDKLYNDGIIFSVNEGKLKIKSPEGVLTDGILKAVKANKNEIIALLNSLAQKNNTLLAAEKIKNMRRESNCLPVSFAQQRLWFIDKMQEGSPEYNMPRALRINGGFNVDVAEQAIIRIIERHESLRTAFSEKDGEVVQIINESFDFSICRHELWNLGPEEQEARIVELITEDIAKVFDLRMDLMVRASYLYLSAEGESIQNGILLFNMHHIASDGWSMQVLIKEFVEYYQTIKNDIDNPLPPLPIQYADYTLWQKKNLEGDVLNQQLAYWRKQLKDIPLVHDLPLDYPRPELKGYSGSVVKGHLSRQISEQLYELARSNEVTLYMLLHGAIGLLLSRHSNTNDIVLGTPVANRQQAELESLIGFFVNTLVLRINTDYQNITEYLAHIRQVNLDAQANQDIPFEYLVEHCQVARTTKHSAIFQIMFNMDTNESNELSLEGLQFAPMAKEHTTTKFDLEIKAGVADSGIHFSWVYDCSLFSHTHMEQLNEHCLRLLQNMAESSDGNIAKFSMLSAEEIHTLVWKMNNTGCDYPQDIWVHELFEQQVALLPDHIAVIFEKQHLTYQQLNERVNRLAHYLMELGINEHSFVGICLDRSADMIVGLLAILKAGAAYVPMDPAYPQSRLEYIIRDIGINYLISTSEYCTKFVSVTELCIISLDLMVLNQKLNKYSVVNPEYIPGKTYTKPAYVIYTSGSTGQPKGVMIEHCAFVNFLYSMTEKLADVFNNQIRLLAVTTVTFDIAGLELFGPLSVGGRLVLASGSDVVDPLRLKELLVLYNINCLQATPATWQMLLDKQWQGKDDLVALSGGEVLPVELAVKLLSRCQNLWNCYGPTEATVWSMAKTVDINNEAQTQIYLGGPLANYTHFVLDKYQQVVPLGVIGELYIGGSGLARGYVNRQELSCERFIANPFANNPKKKLYKTSDLVRYLPDGRLEFIGRIDDQVKIRGYRIELAEIEYVLEQHEFVKKSKVLVQGSNNEDKTIAAYIQLTQASLYDYARRISSDRSSEWMDIWDEAYKQSASGKFSGSCDNRETDTSGWTCSYRGVQIPDKEMLEWIDDTVNIIKELQAEKILEIGVGTGMLLYRYGAVCKSAYVLDFSPHALDKIRKGVEQRGWKHIVIDQAEAIHLEKFNGMEFDTVVLNSVAQYFPDESYFRKVLEQILNCMADGGKILLGDLRNLDLLEAFASSTTLYQAEEFASEKEIKQAISLSIQNEEELMFSPAYFSTLPDIYAEITQVDIRVKEGGFSNEMMRYRYNVILHKNSARPVQVENWYPWENITQLSNFLLSNNNEYFGISGLENRRIKNDLIAVSELNNCNDIDIKKLKESITLNTHCDLLTIQQLAADYGYRMVATWGQDQPCYLDMIFISKAALYCPEIKAKKPYLQEYQINMPQLRAISRCLIPIFRAHVEQYLPSFMLPSAYLLLDYFPLTSNRKIDTAALPQSISVETGTYVAPGNLLEEQLQLIWQNILNRTEISIESNFFDLGGHSLLVIRLINQIRQQLNVEIPVRAVFEQSSIAKLARYIDQATKQEVFQSILPSIAPRKHNAAEPLPLSFAQQRLWFIDRLEEGSSQYNMPIALRLEGAFDLVTVEQAIKFIIQRHESLRTIFEETDTGVVQIIRENVDFRLSRCDLSGLTETEQDRQIHKCLNGDKRKIFDLRKDLMVRAAYISLSKEASERSVGILLFTMHHIASDGWSLQNLVREFVLHYKAVIKEESNPLPPLAIQYADYALWQREWLQGEVLTQQLAYWTKQLEDIPSVHGLSLDYPRPAMKSYKGGLVRGHLNHKTSRELQDVARKKNMTPFMLLHGVLGLVLSRHSYSNDIVLGTPVANRLQAEIEALIGFFVNTLVLRIHTDYEEINDYLAHIRQTNLDAQANQDIPFEYLVEHCQVNRSTQYTPLFQILFNMHTHEPHNLNIPGLKVSSIANDEVAARFDLTVSVNITENGFNIKWLYDKALFHHNHIEQLNEHYLRLLQGIINKPNARISELSMLSSEEVSYLIHELNDTEKSHPNNQLIHKLFERQVEKTPNHIAVICEDQQLSYRELNEAANRLAHYLKAQGVTLNTLVGFCTKRSLDMVKGLFAILKAGGAYVPLDPAYPRQRIENLVLDGNIDIILAQQACMDSIAFPDKKLIAVDKDYQRFPENNLLDKPELEAGQRLAYVIYTSGSTGQPKGVMVSHANVSNFLLFTLDAFMLDGVEGAVVSTPLVFDATVGSLYPPLCCGGYVELLADNENIISELEASLLDTERSLLFKLTPSHLQAMDSYGKRLGNKISRHVLVIAGETLLQNHLHLWQQEILPASILINEYGPTEATVGSTIFTDIESLQFRPESTGSVPIGLPLSNVQCYVMSKHMQLSPPGTIGELCIGGAGVAMGYINRPELSYERFIPDPFSDNPAQRLYRSGDLVRYLLDGNLEFIGRCDDQIKLRGFRIELGEIDYQLSTCERVSSSLVLVWGDEATEKQLIAYVVPQRVPEKASEKISEKMQETKNLDKEDLILGIREHCQNCLPAYMVPSVIMVIEEWPLTINGKINKKALPLPDGSSLSGKYIAPETQTEKVLVDIWAGLLKLNAEAISVTANFFELGGHSLLAVRLVSEIRLRFKLELTVKDIFEHPEIQRLSAVINRCGSSALRRVVTPVARNRNCFPLSFAQQRLWFIDQLQGGSAEYNMPRALQFEGPFDLAVAEQAIVQIIQRHDVLRTVYKEGEQGVVQIIKENFHFKIAIYDLSNLNKEAQEKQINHLKINDSRRLFNLSGDIMVRASYLHLSKITDEVPVGILLFNMHHIASDGWSMQILIKEFVVLYQCIRYGDTKALPPLLIQYADYACWQREWLQEGVLNQQLAYWLQHLEGIPVVHSLALDFPRPAMKAYEGAVVRGELSLDNSEQLQKVARENELTLFMLLHGAIALLLSRHSHSHDIALGTPVANRQQMELEPLIGFFANTLVLRTTSNYEKLKDYLAHVRQVNLDAQVNQDMPFEQLVEHCRVARSTQYSPLFQILFSMDTNEVTQLNLPDLQITSAVRAGVVVKFDLDIKVNINNGRICFNWVYDKTLFTESHIQQLNNHCLQLLDSILAKPDACLAELSMLSQVEIQRLVHESNDTGAVYPLDKQVHELFEERVDKSPHKIALVFEHKQLSYRELNQASNRLAHYLRKQGVGVETLVGLCVERSLDMYIALMAILKAGGAYVPLALNYPQARLQYVLDETELKFLLTESEVRGCLPLPVGCQVIEFNSEAVLDKLDNYSDENPERLPEQGPSNLVYMIYTSGSTGEPKGVMVEHRGFVNLLCAMCERLGDDFGEQTRFLAITTIGFDMAGPELFGLLIQGGQTIVASSDNTMDPLALSDLLTKHDINCLQATPSTWQLLVENQWSGKQNLVGLCGGESFSVSLANQLLSRCARLWNCYGPTEAIVWSMMACVEERTISAESVYLGGALGNYQHFVLCNDQSLAPLGSVGELCIGGKGLARGYFKRPDLNRQKFIRNPFSEISEDRFYKTGDLVRLVENGWFEFVGRSDDQIKLRGFRIELGEIQSQLSKVESIASSVVLMREDEPGEKHLVAYVMGGEKNDSKPIADWLAQLRAHCQRTLPDYMVPSFFLEVDQWPLTSNGKIDKKALPAPDGSSLKGEYVAPETETEKVLVDIWSGLLKLDSSSISITANFFELGGHSLLAVRLVAEIRRQLQQEIAIKTVFEFPDLKILSEKIDRETGIPLRRSVTPVSRSSNCLPLSFAQQRLWFIDQLEEGSSQYNIFRALRIEGQFDVVAAEQAIVRIINRHEVLRTVFDETDGNGVQIIHENVQFKIACHDLSELLDENEQADHVRQLISVERQKVFDLRRDLMIRVSYLCLSGMSAKIPSGILLLTMHHIASDGWSMQNLVKEFIVYYQAQLNGNPEPLAPLNIQYSDYVYWQRKWFQGEVLNQQMNYWIKQLQDIPSVHSLPLDYPRPAMKTYDGALLRGHLQGEIGDQLQEVAATCNMTLFMLLHAILGLVLSRHSHTDDIVLGTPIANRLQVELEPLIGFFANTLVLRTSTTYKKLNDYLAHVRQVNLDAQAHQDVPFEYLVEHCPVIRSTQHTPLFQIMFTMNTNDRSQLNLPGLAISALAGDEMVARFDLTVNARMTEKGLYFSWIYDRSLFRQEHIEQLNDHYQRILQSITERFEMNKHDMLSVTIAELPMLSKEEIHHLLYELNNTKTCYPKHQLIHELFERQVEETPDHTAVVFEDLQITYQELNEAANRLAHYLKNQGVTLNTLVGLCAKRSIDMVKGLLAILKAGGAYVPLDPNYPQHRINSLLLDSNMDVIVSQQLYMESILFQGKKLILLDKDYSEFSSVNLIEDSSLSPRQQLAYVIYTSGSTGNPKGVMVSHANVCNFLIYARNTFMPEPVEGAIVSSALAFDATVGSLYPPLCCGSYVELLPDNENMLEALENTLFDTNRSLLFKLTPAHLEAMAKRIVKRKNKISRHMLVIAGETLLEKQLRIWQQDLLPSSEFINEYGPTEATVGSTTFMGLSGFEYPQHSQQYSLRSVPIGKPLANVECYILNAQNQLLPKGSVGELCIGGAGVAIAYVNQPELTYERFIANPFSENPDERLYRSGDFVRYQADGNLEFIGRFDDQIKIRGFRIELGEISYQISTCKGVRSSLVLVWGEESTDKQLLAYVLAHNESLDKKKLIKEIREHCQISLPNYMVPSLIMVLDEWPLTNNGKINKKSLPLPDGATMLKEEYIAPATATEKALVAIWAELLKLDAGNISVTANFFELGGHSLLLIPLIDQLSKCCECKVGINDIYNDQTILKLANKIDNKRLQLNRASGSIVKLNDSGSKKYLFVFHPLSGRVDCYRDLAKQMTEEMQVYGVQAACYHQYEFRFNTLLELAEYYVQAIKSVQPAGPYHLAGWSAGGKIAFYVAFILQELGEEVKYLSLIDAGVPEPEVKDSFFQKFTKFIRYMYSEEDINVSALLDLIHEQQSREKIIAVMIEELLRLNYMETGESRQKMMFFAGLDFFEAKNPEKILSLACPVRLIIASGKLNQDDYIQRWKQYIISEIKPLVIKGTHRTMMMGECVREIVAIIKKDYKVL